MLHQRDLALQISMRVAVISKNNAISKANTSISLNCLLFLFVGVCWAFSFQNHNGSCSSLRGFIDGLIMGGSLSIFAIVVLKEQVCKTLVYYVTTITFIRLYVPLAMSGYKYILWSISENHGYHYIIGNNLFNVPFVGWFLFNGIYNLLYLLPMFTVISIYNAQPRDESAVKYAKLRMVIQFVVLAHFYIIPDIIETLLFSFLQYSIYESEKYYMSVVYFFKGIGTASVLMIMRSRCLIENKSQSGGVQS